MNPFSGGKKRPVAGRELPLASAAASRGMARRKVGKLLFPVLTVMFVRGLQKLIQQPPWGDLEGFKASSIVSNTWIEIKGHKRLEGVDENWV